MAWLLALVLLSGCITADGVLKPDGSGTMKISYPVNQEVTADSERKRVASPHVKVEKAEVSGARATVQLAVDDVRKLDTSVLFTDVRVTLEEKDEGRRELVARRSNPKPVVLPDAALERLGREVKITLTVPGEVVESNGKTTGPTGVVWEMPTNDFFGVPQRELRVVYKAPSPEKPAEKPASPGKE
jgi:hypothetical protein